MRLLIIVGAVIAALGFIALGLYVWGSRLPEHHTASVERTFAESPSQLYSRISGVALYPTWRKDVRTVEAPEPGRWIEDGSNGRIPYRLVAADPPRRMVVRIDTTELPFEGTWTFELEPAGSGTRLRITENGRVKNAFFRALGSFFHAHDKTIRTYLDHLSAVTPALSASTAVR